MNYFAIVVCFFILITNSNLSAQSTREYKFSQDSVHVFETPTPVNGFYLPYDISTFDKPMYAEPFASNISFPNLAQNIYNDAGSFENTIFGGDLPGFLGFGFTATATIINDTFSTLDFPILLEADFFNRSSSGNYNESYFWVGNSNYTHFNPSNSILPSAEVQQGVIIGGLPERSVISHGRNFSLSSIALLNETHNYANYNTWYNLKVMLDVTEDGRLVIYNIFVDDNCVMSDPIIVDKSDDINLNSFKLAICVDDFAKEFKVTKNADLFQLPNKVVCENGVLFLNPDFADDLCLDFNYFWDLPGSEFGTSSLKSPSNIKYINSGTFESKLTFSNGEFTKVIPFNVVVEPSFTQQINIQLCANDSTFFNNQWILEQGVYQEVVTLQNGCDSTTILEVLFLDSIQTSLDFLICLGDTIEIGQEIYTTQGNFIQNLTSASGCDSTLLININLIDEDLLFDFNECSAIVGSTNMDYSEFTSTFSEISCGTGTLSNIFRSNPLENKHSCTPGLGNSLAMCVESSSDCTYSAGNDKSVVFTFEVTPDEDQHFQIHKLKFFEKSPLMYDWINGPTGLNNYPTKFGFRVLKNGVEIFKEEEIATQGDWNEHKIAFMNNEAFIAKEKATYQFEFLPYCPVGNSSSVSAWDLENISIFTSCLDKENRILSGVVNDYDGKPLVNVNVVKQQNLEIENIMTDENGNFSLTDLVNSDDCEISVLKNDDYLNGVSTLDLILIQKHILGLEIFDQSRKYVAGDVNNDTKVSTADLVELRKLILGITTKLNHNKSWRFVTELPNFDQTSKIELNENYLIEKGFKDLKALNFTGIKIGDINNDHSFNASAETRYKHIEELKYAFEALKNNEKHLQIFLTSNNELNGLQVSFEVDEFEVLGIKSEQINIGQENIFIKDGKINIAYSSPDVILIDKSKPVFTVVLQSTGGNPKFKGLNSNFKNEIYFSDLIERRINIISMENNKIFDFVKAKPNPFKNGTIVEFYASEINPVNVEFYNTAGSLLFSKSLTSSIGLNEIQISADQLGNLSGLYIVRLISGSETHSLKLVLN